MRACELGGAGTGEDGVVCEEPKGEPSREEEKARVRWARLGRSEACPDGPFTDTTPGKVFPKKHIFTEPSLSIDGR